MPSRIANVWHTYAGVDRRVWLLAAIRGVNTAALALVMTFMGIYLIRNRGLSGAEVGWLLLVSNLCQAVTQSYGGAFSDRLGRRPVMAFGLVSSAASFAVLGALVVLQANLVALAAALIVGSTLRGLYDPVANAMVGDLVTTEQRTAAYGLQRMGLNVGWSIGPMVGGLLTLTIPYGAIFFCAIPPLLGCALMVRRLPETVSQSAAPVGPGIASEVRARPDLAVFLASAFISALMQAQFLNVLAIYASTVLGLENDAVGLLYMVNGLMVLLLQMPLVALIVRLGNFRALFIGALIYWFGFAGFGLATGLPLLLGSVAVLTLGEMLFSPAEQSIAVALARPGRLGRTLGAHGAMYMAGMALGPLLGGYAYDHLKHSPELMWAGALGSLCMLMSVGFAQLRRYIR